MLVSARPWATETKLAAAYVNAVKVPKQPVVLAQLGLASAGIDFGQDAASVELYPPRNPLLWWPTRVRHWPAVSQCHLQHDSVSEPPLPAAALPITRRVRFFASSANECADAADLRAVAANFGSHVIIAAADGAVTAEYDSAGDALHAVEQAGKGALRVGTAGVQPGLFVSAELVLKE